MTETTEGDRGAHHRATIRDLNDMLRKTLTGGQVLMTRGIMALGPGAQARVLAAVRAFDDFNDDNDPWREHDMGAFDVAVGLPDSARSWHRVFFKIDYLCLTCEMASEDAADPAKTRRVMTIMLAEEY